MSVSSAPGPGGNDRADRLAMWAGHSHNKIFIVVASFLVVGDVLGNPQSGVLYWVTLPVLIAWGYSLWAAMVPHRKQLCERCISAAPLDPQAQVKRWDKALRLSHGKRLIIGIGVIVAVKVLVLDHLFGTGTWAYAMDGTVLFTLGVTGAAQDLHRKLQPWCPYCHWDDGGKAEIVPQVPDPSVSR